MFLRQWGLPVDGNEDVGWPHLVYLSRVCAAQDPDRDAKDARGMVCGYGPADLFFVYGLGT